MGVQQIKGLVIQNGIRTHKTKQGHLYSGETLGPANQNLRPYSATRGCSTQGGTREPSKKQCSPPKFSFESLSDRFEEWAEEPFFKRNSLNGSAVEGLWACLLALQAVPRSGLSSEPTSEVHRYLVCKILRIYSFITNSPPDQKKNHGRGHCADADGRKPKPLPRGRSRRRGKRKQKRQRTGAGR